MQARKNVGTLFDANRLDHETERTRAKLTEMQLPDGAWPWFPGGPGNDYITLYITTSHFFIDYLPKGVYVFEYSTRVQHRGAYQTGVTEIQCLYAPEFNSHSESLPLVVR